jgi:CDP-glycerol glycerophosphotransferase (TagB/SpsB family)
MGEFLFLKDGDIGQVLGSLIEGGSVHEPAQVIFSAHPKFLSTLERAKTIKSIAALVDIRYINKEALTWEEELIHTKNLMNVIAHTDVMVAGASTMAIDAAVLDTPVVCVNFDGLAKEGEIPYWLSVHRLYDTYTHFEALVETGGLRLAESPEDLARHINDYLKDPARDHEGREKATERFVYNHDGFAGRRLAERVIEEIKKI